MPTKFVCLANSFKEGGRCLAGIELDANNNPVLVNGRPKWIRPVCNTPHGEVPNHIADPFQILDIIQIDVTANQPHGYQSENVLFRTDSLRKISGFNINLLATLCDNRNLIFGNKGKAVPQDAIGDLNHSLILIRTNQFEVIEKTYEDSPNKKQLRMVFSYNNKQYDFPITDPVFLHRYQTNPDFLEEYNSAYFNISLGVVFNDWYYKLVAGIILLGEENNDAVNEDNDDLPF